MREKQLLKMFFYFRAQACPLVSKKRKADSKSSSPSPAPKRSRGRLADENVAEKKETSHLDKNGNDKTPNLSRSSSPAVSEKTHSVPLKRTSSPKKSSRSKERKADKGVEKTNGGVVDTEEDEEMDEDRRCIREAERALRSLSGEFETPPAPFFSYSEDKDDSFYKEVSNDEKTEESKENVKSLKNAKKTEKVTKDSLEETDSALPEKVVVKVEKMDDVSEGNCTDDSGFDPNASTSSENDVDILLRIEQQCATIQSQAESQDEGGVEEHEECKEDMEEEEEDVIVKEEDEQKMEIVDVAQAVNTETEEQARTEEPGPKPEPDSSEPEQVHQEEQVVCKVEPVDDGYLEAENKLVVQAQEPVAHPDILPSRVEGKVHAAELITVTDNVGFLDPQVVVKQEIDIEPFVDPSIKTEEAVSQPIITPVSTCVEETIHLRPGQVCLSCTN